MSVDEYGSSVFVAQGKGGTGISDKFGLQASVFTDRTAADALLDVNNMLRQDVKVQDFLDALNVDNIDPATLDGVYVSVGDKYWVKLSELMQGMTKEVIVGSHMETQLVKEAWDETVETVVKAAWDETITKSAPELAINALKEGALAGIGIATADTLHEAIQTTYIAGNTPGRPEETMPKAVSKEEKNAEGPKKPVEEPKKPEDKGASKANKFDIMAEKLQEEVNRQQAQNRQNGGQDNKSNKPKDDGSR